MPAKYERKKEKGYYRNHLTKALDELKKTGASVNSIAKAFNIPEATLQQHKEKAEVSLNLFKCITRHYRMYHTFTTVLFIGTAN